MVEILELEALSQQLKHEFGNAVEVERIPLLGETGYALRLTPSNKQAARLTVSYAEGIYTIDAEGFGTFDGYDVPGSDERWALQVIRDIANRGLAIKTVRIGGILKRRRLVLLPESQADDAILDSSIVAVAKPWITGTPG